jgi:hypothetical protein
MAVAVNSFDPRRALAALTYLVRESSDDLYILMKMLYVADKMHLAKTGRFMAGDDYVAMEQGATPSGAYDLAKFVRGDHRLHRGLANVGEFFRVENRTKLVLTAEVPEEHLSAISKECLDTVVAMYQQHPNWPYWWRLAHDGAWTASLRDNSLAPPMDLQTVAKATPNNEALLEYLADPYPEAAEG